MPKMEVVSHEYDEETGIDKYVFNIGVRLDKNRIQTFTNVIFHIVYWN